MENEVKESEKLVLDASTFANVRGMLDSADQENVNVALAVIENCNRKASLVYILLLKKICKPNGETWKKQAPEAYKFLKTIGADPDKVCQYKQILKILGAQKAPEKDIQFFLDYFGEYVFKSVKDMGYDFVEGIEIKLNVKEGANATK